MENAKQAALGAETIVMTSRNLEPSLNWLRNNGLDAPDFAGRQLHSSIGRQNVRDY